MSYNNILFDLDGTITDSGMGIINSVTYALNKLGIEVKDKNELFKFVGPPLVDSFKIYYGFSEEKAKEGVAYYREYFKEKGMFENLVYTGVEEILIKLKNNGKKLIIATSKPEIFAREILEHFNLSKYFEYIAGSTLDNERNSKGKVIKYALEACNIEELDKTIMVGDREHDIIGAKEAKISSIGVLYGYGCKSELEKAGADFIIQKLDEIENIVS